MRQEDFYSGEPIAGSPQNFSEMSPEQEATQMAASFGKYFYDPGSRMMNSPMTINPGGYGYNYNMYPQQFTGQPMYGLGSPMRYGNGFGYPYPNMYGQYPNQNIPNYSMPHQENIIYHIPGIRMSGEYMPDSDYEEQIERLKMEYWQRQQEIEAKSQVEMSRSVYNNGNGYGLNYYGLPYYNPYQYNSLNAEFNKKVNEMQEAARDRRKNFDLNISRLAHKFAGDGVSEEEILTRYNGQDVELPAASGWSPEALWQQNRLHNMVPFDNSQMYRDHFNKVTNEHNKIISADSNMKDAFNNMGILQCQYELEEEDHRRRDGGQMYDMNSYKYFVRKKAAERYATEKGIPMTNTINVNPQQLREEALQNLPTLSQSARLADDGTLHVTCNFGSHKGETYSVNQNEAGYDDKRERFNRFINSIPGVIYNNTIQGG